jgi:ribosomal protein S18 acetylase RimI-like enzyme
MIRAALPGEVDAIAELYHQVWHEAEAGFVPEEERRRRTRAFFAERLQSRISTMLVAQETDGLVGFVSWRGNYVGQLYVRAAYRGRGVATDLLAAAESAMAAAGIVDAELHCALGNHRAYRFYIRNQWSSTGLIGKLVAGPGGPVDSQCWRMCKRLQ